MANSKTKKTKPANTKSAKTKPVNTKSTNVNQGVQKPFYKTWWFWVLVVVLLGVIGYFYKPNSKEGTSGNNNSSSSSPSEVKMISDYTGKDAKQAYDELTREGHSVRFAFDRNNNGGFSDSDFQDFVKNDSFGSSSYAEMPFTVTNQVNSEHMVTLFIEYTDVYIEENAQAAREKKLEEKLSIVSAMTACEQYGKSHYKNFKMHSIMGRIAERASDDNTWFLKYYVDYDGYKNKNMECYVSGTTSSPSVMKFSVY